MSKRTVAVALTFNLDADALVAAVGGLLGDSCLYGGDEPYEKACRIVEDWWPNQSALLTDVAAHVSANQGLGGSGWVEEGDKLWHVARHLVRRRFPAAARNLKEPHEGLQRIPAST